MKTLIQQTTPKSKAITEWKFITDENGSGFLFITFTSGSEYVYDNCPLELVVPMLTQASIGAYFARTIKPYFPESQVTLYSNENGRLARV